MSDFKKIETDAVERCKRILDSMTADEAMDLTVAVLEDEKELEGLLKVLFGFFAMAKLQRRTEEPKKICHIAAYLSTQGLLFEEFKKSKAAEGN